MQNLASKTYLNKIINIQSEMLFREAEDDVYYFNKLGLAVKKLKKSVELTPCHLKSILLYADVCFIRGYIKKALTLYLKAEELSDSNVKAAASIANCYNLLNNYKMAVLYCNKALDYMKEPNYSLFSQLIEIKITNLVKLKKYKDAYITFIQSQSYLDSVSLKTIYANNYEIINEKIKLQRKLRYSGLKIV